MGLKPIVLDRGQDVRQRTKDTWELWKSGTLNPESNVQFGEGGAGTFSDGKLWTQVKDKSFLLSGVDLQRDLEKLAYELGGGDYKAPAQLIGDFLQDKPSTELGTVIPSYKPGITLGDLSKALPKFAVDTIREAIPVFDKKIPGYAMNDAILTGVETRTSAPVCIRRDKSFQSINTNGLYPAGEGAGYAGGILSAAIDGIKAAEAVAKSILKLPEG